MEQYHIGQEIEKEMRAQGMTAKQLAEKINLTPQALYDIFKKSHIATDRLMDIQHVLGRNFFKELSQLVQHGGMLAEEEAENAAQEQFEMLLPEDKLHVIDYYALRELAEEFVMSEHRRPLVIFYSDDWTIPDKFHDTVDHKLGVGKVYLLDLRKEHKKGRSNEEIIRFVESMPHPVVNISGPGLDDEDFRFMVDLSEATGKQVYAFCKSIQEINYKGMFGNPEHRDTAIAHFSAWHEHIHFAFADREFKTYRKTRQLFLANFGYDILFFIQIHLPDMREVGNDYDNKSETVMEWLNNPKLLYKEYREWLDEKAEMYGYLKEFRLMYLDDLDIKQEGSRWILGLPWDSRLEEKYESQLFIRRQNRKMKSSMWIEVEDNRIVDYEESVYQMFYTGDDGK